MGIKTIMESKEILLLASGSKKAEALYKLLTGRPDEQYPASELLNHPKVTIIADQDALSLYLSRREKLSLNLNIN
jgi:glucosamine-6-phosphate deaminase